MIVREKNEESLVEYNLHEGKRINMKELYSDIDYNELLDSISDTKDISLFEYVLSLEDSDVDMELDTFVDIVSSILNIGEIEGYVALIMAFKPVDLNILKTIELEELLDSRVTRQEYWSIVNRLLGIGNKNIFTDEQDKFGAITIVESAYYILQSFEGYVDNSEVIQILCMIYGVDMREQKYLVSLASEEDIEMSLEAYIEGSISAYNVSVLYENEKLIYPYIKTMSEIIYQELIFEDEVTYNLEKDLLREITYRDLFYMIYKFLVFKPAE